MGSGALMGGPPPPPGFILEDESGSVPEYGGGGQGTGKPLRVNIYGDVPPPPPGFEMMHAGQEALYSTPIGLTDVPPSSSPQEHVTGTAGQAALVGAGDTASFGLLDELSALGSTVLPGRDSYWSAPKGRSFGDSYDLNLQQARGAMGDIAEDRPVSYTIGQLGGALAIPMGAARTAPQIAKIGGAMGAAYGVGSGEDLESRLTGGVTGGVTGALTGYGLGKIGEKLAARRLAKLGDVSQQAARGADLVGEGERARVRVLTSDALPPQTFVGKMAQATGERVLGMGTGSIRAAQQAERVGAVKTLLSDFGADETARALTDDVAADLIKTRGDELGRLTKIKNSVIDQLGDAVEAPNAVRSIDQQIAKLRGINEDAYAPVISKLESFKQVLQSGKNLQQIEGNRRLLGDLFKDPNLASIRGDGEKALNAIYGPLREDMGNFIREKGGEAAFNRWKNANDKLAGMAGELSSAAFKRVLNSAEMTPENVANILFNKNPSEVTRLYANLSPKGQAKAQAAILQRAMEKAGGLEDLSPDKFVNEIERLGKNVGIVFQGEDLARVNGLAKLLNATQRAATASVAPPTGVQGFIGGLYGGAGVVGGLKGIAAIQGYGLMARAYESVAVRNMLLKLGKAKVGSTQERNLTQKTAKLIASMTGMEGGKLPGALNDNASGIGRAAASGEGPDQGKQR